MASDLFASPFVPSFDSNGLPGAGYQLRFRYTGSDNAAPIYSDASLTTPMTNPVVANGAGRVDPIYLDDTIVYRVDFLNASGVEIDSVDPFVPGETVAYTELASIVAAVSAAANSASASAAASAASSASSAAAAASSVTDAENAAEAALLSNGSYYATKAEGVAATSVDELFVSDEDGSLTVYLHIAGSPFYQLLYDTAGAGGAGNSFASHALLRAAEPSNGDIARLEYRNAPPRVFVFDSSDRTTQINIDPTGIANVAPDSDPTGASGCWRLIYDGIIYAEWSDEYVSSADATDACQAAWDYLVVSGSDAKAWEFIRELTTFGLGDKCIKAEYANEASLPAVGTLTEYDVVYAQAEETLWRVRDLGSGNEYVQIQNRSLNGKALFSRTVAKSAGLKLKASSPNWAGFKFSVNDGRFENVFFNGDHSSRNGGFLTSAQNNPNTDTLVYLEGYGIDWCNNMVRFSGGEGIRMKGIIGNIHIRGGDCVSQYNMGAGWVFERGSSIKASKLWCEGNRGPDVLLKHDMLAADADLATATNYWKQSCIEIESIYSEQALHTVPIVQIEGGHYAPRIGTIARHGTGSDRVSVYLKNSADSDSIYQGCQGGLFQLGGGLNHRVVIESEARGNTFIRQAQFWTNFENGSWIFEDAGKDNTCLWASLDANAYTPGHRISATSLNADSTSFVDEQAAATGTVTIVDGGVYSPIHDYHPDYVTGPSFVRFSNMETRLGGGVQGRCTARCNAATTVTQTYYAIVSLKAKAHQSVYLVLYDQTNNEYYNWDSQTWTASGSADDWGFQKIIRADERHLHYLFAFENNGANAATRSLRPQIRVTGSGTLDAYHIAITDIPDSALFSVVNGVHMGPVNAPTCTVAALPGAAKVPLGTPACVKDASAPTLGSTVAGGGAVYVGVHSNGTNWIVG